MTESFDINNLMAQAAGMAEQLQRQKEEADARVVTGNAGGGAVSVEMTGGLEFLSVTIKPEVVDPSDITMLQDLVLAALNDAASQIEEAGEGQAKSAEDMLGGFDLSEMLGGALGGGDPGPGDTPE